MSWGKAFKAKVTTNKAVTQTSPDPGTKVWLVLTWLQLALVWGALIFLVLRLHDANDMVYSLETTVRKMEQELDWEWEEE